MFWRLLFISMLIIGQIGMSVASPVDYSDQITTSDPTESNSFNQSNIRVQDENYQNASLKADGKLFYIFQDNEFSTVHIRSTDGQEIASLQIDLVGIGDVELFNETTVIVTIYGENVLLWNYISDNIQKLPFKSHHDIIFNHNTGTFLTLQFDWVEESFDYYLFDTVTEYTPEGEQIWQFNFSSILSEDDWTGGYVKSEYKDISHANSLAWNSTSGKVWVNLRNTNQIYQLDYMSKSVDWILGNNGDFQQYDEFMVLRDSLFQEAHDLQMINSTTIMLFDNKYENYIRFDQIRSRIIMISLNTSIMDASIVYEWVAPSQYYSPIWGSAKLLPNGNIIASFGFIDDPVIVEINRTNDEYHLLELPRPVYSVAFQYEGPQVLLTGTRNIIRNSSMTVEFALRSSYSWNFNQEIQITSELNSTPIREETIELYKNWLITPYNLIFSDIVSGEYNLSISLTVKTGYEYNFSFIIEIRDYYFSNNSSIVLEKGHPVVLPIFGKFRSNVTLELFRSSYSYFNSSWSGIEVVLDQSIFPIGNTTVQFRVSNTTMVLEEGDISISIKPKSAPKYTVIHPDPLVFQWGDPVTFDLMIEEYSSYDLTLTSEGVVWFSDTYVIGQNYVRITLSQLYEGYHRFELNITDALGLSHISDLLIQIVPPDNPVIISKNIDFLQWGLTNHLIWEVHGGDKIKVFRDGMLLESSTLTANQFRYEIKWRQDQWKLKEYNITTIVSNDNSSTTSMEYLKVNVSDKNPYASSIVESHTFWVENAERSVGAPDGEVAEINFGYENGKLTMDVGATIINSVGDDITIFADGGNYRIFAATSLQTSFHEIGRGQGYGTYDIQELESVRFIQIRYFAGAPIEVDAIKAKSIVSEEDDTYHNLNLDQINIPWDQDHVNLTWNVSDYLGIAYTISVNGEEQVDSSWDGDSITYSLPTDNLSQNYNVTLVLERITGELLFGHAMVAVTDRPNFLIPSVIIIALIIILTRYIYQKKSR